MLPILYIVIPCYNESEVLPTSCTIFKEKLESYINSGKVSQDSRILFVNDGSTDDTYDIIESLARQNNLYCGISLSRNRGHQNALLAGLHEAAEYCDISISIDCDGQDDINAMDGFIENYEKGCDIVYGVRSSRANDSFLKRITAEGFYKFMNTMGANVVFNHADYRLMSKNAIDALFEFSEVNLFLRGLVPLVGFKSTVVEYERSKRIAGKSHYPLSKMLALAIDGITSLSNRPLHLITTLGVFISILGFVGAVWTLIQYFFGSTVNGWSSTTFAIFFMGGVQLLCLGIIGEYIGKIYLETKRRPRFIIARRTVGNNVDN